MLRQHSLVINTLNAINEQNDWSSVWKIQTKLQNRLDVKPRHDVVVSVCQMLEYFNFINIDEKAGKTYVKINPNINMNDFNEKT